MPAAPFTVPTANVTHGSIRGAYEALLTSIDESYSLDPAEAAAEIQAHVSAYADVLEDAGADPAVTADAVELCQQAADMICLCRTDDNNIADNHPFIYAARALLLRARAMVGRDIVT